MDRVRGIAALKRTQLALQPYHPEHACLTVLIWSVDTRCLWAQSLKLVQLYLHTQSLKSLTNHVALDTVNIVPYLDHYTKLLIGLPGPPSLSPWSLFFTYLLELIS